MVNKDGFTQERVLEINGFEQNGICRWELKNDFGILRVDTRKKIIEFKLTVVADQENFVQEYTDELFDPALVTAFMRSGMYDYLREKLLERDAGVLDG